MTFGPKNACERDFNESMTEKAEAIRCRRYEAIVNERYDFFDKNLMKGDLLEYYRLHVPDFNGVQSLEVLQSLFD